VIGDEPGNTDYDPGPSERAVSRGEERKHAAQMTLAAVPCFVCLTMKPVGEPYAGNPHVRFDERGWETRRCRMAQAVAPILDSTNSDVGECPRNVRYRGYIGSEILTASISHVDPLRSFVR